jgi:pimeloyl-ACP methyl ester carboxylesterase
MTSSYSFRYVLEPLGRSYTVIVPDLPGSGRSEPRPDRPHTAAALAALLGDLQRVLGIEGCPVIGNSMGGYLAMHLALMRRRAFSRLVVVHSPALPDLRLRALHAVLSLPGAASVLAVLVGRSPERWVHANVHYRDETLKSREEAREYGLPLSTPAGVRSFYRYLYETLAPAEMHDFCRRLRRAPFPLPLSLVYAREDPMVPPRVGPALHALVPAAEFHWLDRSSHFAHVDSPERLLTIIEPFLAGRGAASPHDAARRVA